MRWMVLVALSSLMGCGAPLVDRDWLAIDSYLQSDGPNGYRFRLNGTYVRLSTAKPLIPDGAPYCVFEEEQGGYEDLGDRVVLNGERELFYRFEGGRLLLEVDGEQPSAEAYDAVQPAAAPACRRPACGEPGLCGL